MTIATDTTAGTDHLVIDRPNGMTTVTVPIDHPRGMAGSGSKVTEINIGAMTIGIDTATHLVIALGSVPPPTRTNVAS